MFKIVYRKDRNKATGIDKIPAKVLKIAAPIITESPTNIFNYAIINESFPFDWKIVRVTPISKNGRRDLLDNYRPISILPIISKLFEKILYEQLYEYLNSENLIFELWFGFRQRHSTTTALLDCTNEWFTNMDWGLSNLVVFLNLQKAFDRVNHEILVKKLDFYGIEESVSNLFQSFLSDRIQRCRSYVPF